MKSDGLKKDKATGSHSFQLPIRQIAYAVIQSAFLGEIKVGVN